MFNRKRVLLVTICWPADPERGQETYGPFKRKAAQEAFVDDCITAADQGHPGLEGAHFELHPAYKPFDPLSETCGRKPGLWAAIVETVSLRGLAGTDWCIDAKTGLRRMVSIAVYSLPWV
jgi:hypothetical protein